MNSIVMDFITEKSQAFSPNISAWPHYYSGDWKGTNAHRHAPNFSAEPY